MSKIINTENLSKPSSLSFTQIGYKSIDINAFVKLNKLESLILDLLS